MPGITGIIGKGPRGQHKADLRIMLECMMHEAFYQRGSYVDEELGIYVGWTCHPGSFADCMPVVDEEQRVVLIFSGEHFGDDASLQMERVGWLLRRYKQKGIEFLRELNGWYSGLLIDQHKSSVVLFNDRFGMHRVHYHEGKDVFLFGSEAKSLLSVRPELRRIDLRGMSEQAYCGCVLEGRTLFPGVSLLPGGSAWQWEGRSGPRKHVYFSPHEWEGLLQIDEESFFGQLKETALAIMPRYFREKRQVGVSLTGGLDSRMMMACLNPAPGELPCYTFGGAYDIRDIAIARQVAKLYGQSYSVVRLGKEFFEQFSRLAEKTIRLTDGNLDVCSTHDMYFNELAREIAPIRVTGKFGSEVVRDHTMFNASEYQERLFSNDLKPFMREAIDTFREVKKGHQLSVSIFKDFPWREYNKIALEQSQMVLRSPYMDNDLVELMYRAPVGVRSQNWPQRRIIKECNAGLGEILSDMGFGEGRNPIIARWFELYYHTMFKLDYRYVFALPHWLTRVDTVVMAMNGEQPILGSQKFEHYRIWFRRELSNYVKDVLLDPQTARRPYFDKKSLEMMVQTHTSGTRNYINEINKALSLELTCRLLIDT
jgi:asparagine synthase (glutamine-hydrolysing)